MAFDLEMIKSVYARVTERVDKAKKYYIHIFGKVCLLKLLRGLKIMSILLQIG